MKYSIYQLNQTELGKSLLFLPYDKVRNKVDARNYDKVWEGEVEDLETPCRTICAELANNLPAGYYGHVPTVSDVIVFDNGTAFYIDVVGYKEISGFNI